MEFCYGKQILRIVFENVPSRQISNFGNMFGRFWQNIIFSKFVLKIDYFRKQISSVFYCFFRVFRATIEKIKNILKTYALYTSV